MDNLRYKTFTVEINGQIEHVRILDKYFDGEKDKYLVVVVGEQALLYKEGKEYRDHQGLQEIITPNKNKIFAILPGSIISNSNRK